MIIRLKFEFKLSMYGFLDRTGFIMNIFIIICNDNISNNNDKTEIIIVIIELKFEFELSLYGFLDRTGLNIALD